MADVEIKLRPSQERLESLKFGYVRKGQKGDTDAMGRLIAHFMIGNDGRYLQPLVALDIIDDLSFKEIGEAFAGLENVMIESAAPKGSETPSTSQP